MRHTRRNESSDQPFPAWKFHFTRIISCMNCFMFDLQYVWLGWKLLCYTVNTFKCAGGPHRCVSPLYQRDILWWGLCVCVAILLRLACCATKTGDPSSISTNGQYQCQLSELSTCYGAQTIATRETTSAGRVAWPPNPLVCHAHLHRCSLTPFA